MVCLHFLACIWINLGLEDGGWIEASKNKCLADDSLSTYYLAALYWAITTFATIGYGDFSGINDIDYIFCMGAYVVFIFKYSYLEYLCLHIYLEVLMDLFLNLIMKPI